MKLMSGLKRITWSSSGQNGIRLDMPFPKPRIQHFCGKYGLWLQFTVLEGIHSTSRHTDICETISDIMNSFWFVCFILQTDCTSNQVRCSDGRCIPSNWICGFYYCPFGTNGTGVVDCSKFLVLQWIHAH